MSAPETDDWFARRTHAWDDWSLEADEARLGALDTSDRPTHDDFMTFADLDATVPPGASVFADADEDIEVFDDERDFDAAWEPEDDDDVLVPYDEPAAPPRARRTAPARGARGPGLTRRGSRRVRSAGTPRRAWAAPYRGAGRLPVPRSIVRVRRAAPAG